MPQFIVGTDHIEVHLNTDPTTPAAISWVGTPGGQPRYPARAHQPLVEVLTPLLGNVNHSNSTRWSGTSLGARLRYLSHEVAKSSLGTTVEIVQTDPASGLVATCNLTLGRSSATVHATTTLSLPSDAQPLPLWGVTTLALGAWLSEDPNNIEVWSAACTWGAENRWTSEALRAPGLVQTDKQAHGETCRGAIAKTSYSTWSSGEYLPLGVAVNGSQGGAMAWQIEHNGPWRWELGERPGWYLEHTIRVAESEAAGPPQNDHRSDGVYLALLGPTDLHHHWNITLAPGETFTTVPATISIGSDRDTALGELTKYRRATRRPHPQNATLPVIFNDYMDTLEGDPTEAKLLPLIDAAAEVGAEYFCIDAGWYDDTEGWWASVGDWEPSTARFPHGLSAVLGHIRNSKLIPGLWMEPEVVGVTSRAARTLPAEAFLTRNGVRIQERSRYFLDLRHPAARAHLDAAVDRLVNHLGVGYFKFDYNVTPGPGTDNHAQSPGEGLLEHNRALLTWIDGVLDRHPDLIIENCGSGAMRSDFAMLSHFQLQSTSDQQDPLLYPAIAVAALAHILPEQAGNWSYPQATMSDEMIAFNMVTGLAGRVYQSGLLDRMTPQQKALVADGLRVHKETRATIANSIPRFPTGLPTWADPWVTVAFENSDATFVLAWRQAWAPDSLDITLPWAPESSTVEQIYPSPALFTSWQADLRENTLHITTKDPQPAARMWKLRSN